VSKLDAVFLDFDGVILESIDVKSWAFGKLFEDFPEQVERIVKYHMDNGGVSRYVKFRHIYKEILNLPLSEKRFKELCDQFSELVFKRVLECEFVRGAEEFLEKYFKLASLYVISGTPQEEIRSVVNQRGLNKFFKGVYGSPNGKDHWVKELIKENGFDKNKAIFVGDAMSDCEAAEQNGCDFFARLPEEEKDIFEGKKVKHKVKDLIELDQILERDYQ